MNSDLISRSKLKDKLKINFSRKPEAQKIYQHLIDIVDDCPTVNIIQHKDWYLVNMAGAKELLDREKPQGEWKRHDEWRSGEYIGGFYHVNCPCEDGYYSKWETNFCPNCGLPMKKGGAE